MTTPGTTQAGGGELHKRPATPGLTHRTSTTGVTPAAGGREGKEIEHTLQEGMQQLLTAALLMFAFLFGALTSGGLQKMGLLGGRSHYVSSHWDRETVDAHHALDVVLDHLKHPHLYQTKSHESYLQKARSGLLDIFHGILPSRMTSSKKSGRDMYDQVRDTGRDVYDKATGRSMYDKATGRGLMDKASDLTHDLTYGARRGMESVKDVGYGITNKLGDAVDSVKDTFSSGRSNYPGEYVKEKVGSGSSGGWLSNLVGKGKESMMDQTEHDTRSRGWFSSRDGDEYGESDDLDVAARKIKAKVRQAERDY